MTQSGIPGNKTILAVDDEPDVLAIVQELLESHGDPILHTAGTFEKARELLYSHNYDVVVLDIMGVRGFDLIDIATHRNFPVIMLTAHALNPESLKKSIELGARAYLPKERLIDLVPFMNDVLTENYQSVWKKVVRDVFALFNDRFGSQWKKSEHKFWEEFETSLSLEKPAIIGEPGRDK